MTTERLKYAERGYQRYVTHLDIVGKGQPRALSCAKVKSTSTRIEGVLLERPRQLQGIVPSPMPPNVPHYHLRVPDDVSIALGASTAHQLGRVGEGVTVAMVDSGQYAHPFFAAHSYNVKPTISVIPGADPGKDPVGHGTGESANIFATAPAIELQPYRVSNDHGRLVGGIGGFMSAKQSKPSVITNSWGSDGPYPPPGQPDPDEITWSLEIIDAIQQGILVVFAAGNSTFTIEPQIPDVLGAGGVYMDSNFDLRASNYSSGYPSPWFNNRVVPDVCGLVGQLPRAAYIMLPVPPGSELDIVSSRPQGADPGDGTNANDGWGLFSGTSAAAPQLAGVAALIISAKPGVTPAQVIKAMKETAIDVRSGNCHPRFNNPALLGQDAATGFGLVNANAAVEYALAHF